MDRVAIMLGGAEGEAGCVRSHYQILLPDIE